MIYRTPEVKTVKYEPVGFAQTGFRVTDLGGAPEGDPCLEFAFDQDLNPGSPNFILELEFDIPNSCSGKYTISGAGIASGKTLSIDCNAVKVSCDTTCQATPNASGRVCLTSFELDGQTPNNLPFCVDISDGTEMDKYITACV